MRYWNFSFIVSELVQVNPDNSRAMSALTFLLFKFNTLQANIYYIYRIVSIYLPFSEVHSPLLVSKISSELILYITASPLYLFSLRLMQLNVCHILHSWHELLKYSPTYRLFPHDSSQFAGCFLLQSVTITIYFGLSPNHAIICFTSSVPLSLVSISLYLSYLSCLSQEKNS